VTSIIGGLIAAISALLANTSALFVISLSLSVFGITAIAGTAFVLLYRKRRNSYVSYPEIEFSTRVRKKHFSYLVSEDGVLRFIRTLELEALVDNVDRYTDKFMWTGGESEIPRPGEGVVETRPLLKAGIWTYYDSMFDTALRRGERITITTEWPPLRNWPSSNPFVSTSAEEQTDEIRFRVVIPKKFRENDRVIMEEMRSIESPYPFKTHPHLSFTGDEFVTTIKPQPYRHYRVRWSWKGEDQAVTIEEAVEAVEAEQG
jgi:hypothetical protein